MNDIELNHKELFENQHDARQVAQQSERLINLNFAVARNNRLKCLNDLQEIRTAVTETKSTWLQVQTK